MWCEEKEWEYQDLTLAFDLALFTSLLRIELTVFLKDKERKKGVNLFVYLNWQILVHIFLDTTIKKPYSKIKRKNYGKIKKMWK